MLTLVTLGESRLVLQIEDDYTRPALVISPSLDSTSSASPRLGESISKKRKLATSEDSKKVMEHFKNQACKMFARWMYDAGISFNGANYESFGPAIEAIGQHGPGMKPPTYHEVRVPLLNNEVEETNKIVEEHKKEWEKGAFFLESIDASDYSKIGEKILESMENCVKAVGENHVIKVVTDSAANNVKPGKMLMRMYPHIYWTPCAAHCIDLMLEGIFKIRKLKDTCSSAMALCGFIYARPGTVNMLRYFTKLKELLRPAKTRFATSCIMLGRLYLLKASLQKMFVSEEWIASKWSKENSGKRATATVLKISFWRNIAFALKVCGPLIKVLRIVDGETKPSMRYIYGAMERAKSVIVSSFESENEYKKAFEIIDHRWEVRGRLVPDTTIQNAIIDEIAVYKYATDSFSSEMAKRARKQLAPGEDLNWDDVCIALGDEEPL
ncbi:hypothetical protein POM88_021822 [Heracleum sosnowskyi]|uniref:DUF659 domain-containing protein n=1 Tax=Heracleum sosnowskyi TaxID=360622 RepID=A0AAD8IGM0_9APIA|nr:hypothetical protein POM88_021822 [Heracleum sosnowskyi]